MLDLETVTRPQECDSNSQIPIAHKEKIRLLTVGRYVVTYINGIVFDSNLQK